MNIKNTTKPMKLGYYVATGILFFGAISIPAFAQKDTSVLTPSNSILDLDLLRGTAADDLTQEIPSERYDNTKDTALSAKVLISINTEATSAVTGISDADSMNNTVQSGTKGTVSTTSETKNDAAMISAINREPVVALETTATDTTNYWQNFESNNGIANQQKGGALISSLKFWFNQFFNFRNMQNSSSTLYINDLHTVTSKKSVWIGWATNNVAFSSIYYSTTTPVEVESSVVATTSQGATSLTIRNLDLNTKYYFRILSKDVYGNTTVSDESSFTTK